MGRQNTCTIDAVALSVRVGCLLFGSLSALACGASHDGRAPLPPDPCIAAGTCPPGLWINVTPSDMPASVLRPTANVFGPGTIVGDPARPSDLYVGGSSAGLWKSTDYGFSWTLINDTLPDVPRGTVSDTSSSASVSPTSSSMSCLSGNFAS